MITLNKSDKVFMSSSGYEYFPNFSNEEFIKTLDKVLENYILSGEEIKRTMILKLTDSVNLSMLFLPEYGIMCFFTYPTEKRFYVTLNSNLKFKEKYGKTFFIKNRTLYNTGTKY